MKVATRLFGVALLAAAFAPIVVAAPAQAAPVTHKYFQFNMCGNKCNSGSLAVADDVINSVNASSPQPFVITLNEVCRSQYNRIYLTLAPYYGPFEVTKPSGCADGSDYGNVVLLRTSSYTYMGYRWLPNPYDREDRKVHCLRTSATGGGTQPLVACVTHIEPASDTRAAQILAVSNFVETFYSGNHVMVGGDFNVTPNNSGINPMYHSGYHSPGGANGIFDEADRASNLSRITQSGTINESTLGLDKKDYIFLSRYDYSNISGDATSAPRSDHDPLWATVTYN